MANIQPTKTESGNGSKEAISGALTKSQLVAATGPDGSANSSKNMTATTLSASSKTWTNAQLAELRSKAGLVAGALADFQAAGGLVAARKVEYERAGVKMTATKLILVAEGLHLTLEETVDGLDFNLVAVEPSGSVSQPSGSQA